MKRLLLAAVAAAAISAPAAARDNNWYMGVEAGAMAVKDIDFDRTGVNEGIPFTNEDYYQIDFKTGIDIDVIGGYDFGLVRGEVEFGYKHANVDEVGGFGFTEISDSVDGDGDVRVVSIMGNALLDFGDDDGLSFYAGGGVGYAKVNLRNIEGDFSSDLDAKDSGLAWQLIAGFRHAVAQNVQLGLKYRFFRGPRIEDDDDFDRADREIHGDRFRSHSLLLSLIYHAGEPPRPAPPPPPPPLPPPPPPPAATQTCPDGSVILATDACPPPPPPPPPPPGPERG